MGEVITEAQYEYIVYLDGVRGFVFHVHADGQEITISGWDDRHWNWREGDRVLLKQDSGDETRYRITEIKHCGDPRDMYFFTATFNPRITAV